MKVIIAGSRTMPRELASLVEDAILKSGYNITEVVCGDARGADTWGRNWADEHEIPVASFPADWRKHGFDAGMIRNAEMADYADAAIVLRWNYSKGSTNMIEQMRRRGKPCFVVDNGDI